MVKYGYNIIDNKLIFLPTNGEEVLCGVWENNAWKLRRVLKIMNVLSEADFEASKVQPYENMDKWMQEHTIESL